MISNMFINWIFFYILVTEEHHKDQWSCSRDTTWTTQKAFIRPWWIFYKYQQKVSVCILTDIIPEILLSLGISLSLTWINLTFWFFQIEQSKCVHCIFYSKFISNELFMQGTDVNSFFFVTFTLV